MENRKQFTCDKCGLCCRNIGHIAELKEFDDGNGVCMSLSSDNLCKIYENRPDICNVEIMFSKKYRLSMTWDDYVSFNKRGCELLKNLGK